MAPTATATSRHELRTFLIADVRGYTRFTAEHGDDAAAHLAATFAALARDAVEARAGRVIELRGDEVLAVFDAADQSVRAALELQWTCAEEVATDPSMPLLIGIGIAAGEAVPVEDGFRGAALNLAARLCSTASAGEVLLSEWVVGLADPIEGMSFQGQGTVELKGFPDPVPYYRVTPDHLPSRVARSEAVGRMGLPAELDAGLPLIGREHEMRWARGTWRQVQRERGRVVVVSGPSGIGKTRLAAEIAAHVQATGGEVRYAGAGGTAIADIATSIDAAHTAATPTLVILDDLDAAGERAANMLAQGLAELGHRAVLVLALAQHPDAFPSLAALVGVLDVRGDAHRTLRPLDLEGVRELCRIYAGDDVAEAPIESITRSSGGVPAQVHEMMSGWARDEATRRLEAAAQWLSTGRERRSAGLGFANNVIGLKLDRIYRMPEAGEDPVCPYKGLASYREEDARFFFGRENLVGELAARSVGVGLLGVVGASGSGKSSVVAAGLRSSLASGLLPGSARWRQVSLRPGEHPMAELRSALGALVPGDGDGDQISWATDAMGPDERLVVYVDQFEEIFTTSTDQEEIATFVRALGRASAIPERALVVGCLRGDFYAHISAHPELADAFSANHVIVGPMSPEEVRRAIELPARRTGLLVESALVDRLVEEASEAPGALPLLSTALVELWSQRSDGWIRLDAHERTGGLNGAVARLAEQTYGQLTDAQKAAAPVVFLRLVGPGEGDAVTRRRVSLDEFDAETDEATAKVLRRFTQDRLLSADDRTVEVAHEALIREWPRLRTWLAEDAQGRELRAHLRTAARTWEDTDEEDSELYRGARLSATLDWASTHDRHLNELERSFLTASRQAGDREIERQRRSNRRLRGLLVGVALFLVVSLVAGSLALVQRSRAAQASTAAQAKALQADAERIGAQALTEPNLDRSMLMALAGVQLNDELQTRANLFAALQRNPAATHAIRPSADDIPAIAVSPDGSLLASGDNSGIVRFDSLDSWTQSGEGITLGHGLDRRGMTFSPDGRTLLVGADSLLFAIDVEARTVRRLASWSSAWSIAGLAFTPDGSDVAVGLAGGFTTTGPMLARLVMLDAATGRAVWDRPYPVLKGQHEVWLAFTPRGRLVTSSQQGNTYIWDAQAGQIRRRLQVGGLLALLSGGRYAALAQNNPRVAHQEGGMAILDLRTDRSRLLQGGMDSWIQALAATPDGKTIIGGFTDGEIRTWDVRSGRIVETFTGQASAQEDLAIGSGDHTLLSAAADGSVVAWDLAGNERLGAAFSWNRPELGCPLTPCMVINRQGTLMATDQWDGTTQLIDLHTHQSVGTLPARDGTEEDGLAFFPDGRTLATGGVNGHVTIWDTQTQRALHTLRLHDPVWAVAVNPDGNLLATQRWEISSATSYVQLWDVKTRRQLRIYEMGGMAGLPGLTFSPDGRELVAINGAKVEVWDVRSGEKLFSPDSSSPSAVAFSIDGSLFAVGMSDGRVALLDPRSGEAVGKPIIASGSIMQISFSPNGQLVALSSSDLTQTLWDLSSRGQVGMIPPPGPAEGPDGEFAPNGDLVVVYLANAVEWPTDPTLWENYACQVAGRDMTPDEWQQLLPDRPYESICPTRSV